DGVASDSSVREANCAGAGGTGAAVGGLPGLNLNRAVWGRCPPSIAAVNRASIISATHQFTLHFANDDALADSTRRRLIRRTRESWIRVGLAIRRTWRPRQ